VPVSSWVTGSPLSPPTRSPLPPTENLLGWVWMRPSPTFASPWNRHSVPTTGGAGLVPAAEPNYLPYLRHTMRLSTAQERRLGGGSQSGWCLSAEREASWERIGLRRGRLQLVRSERLRFDGGRARKQEGSSRTVASAHPRGSPRALRAMPVAELRALARRGAELLEETGDVDDVPVPR
jgi:hypothetical protein